MAASEQTESSNSEGQRRDQHLAHLEGPVMASRTTRSFPTMTRWTFTSIRPRSSAVR